MRMVDDLCRVLGLQFVSIFIPLYENSQFAQRVANFIFTHAPDYFPMELVVEDPAAFDPNGVYVFGAEPHSILPVGLLGFSKSIGQLSSSKMRIGATSAIFHSPIIRHIWSWMGMVPVSKKLLLKYLENGYSVILVPGGVREVLLMEHDHEVVFLRKRYGFVRAAIKTGSSLVPCFMFGQKYVYRWWKPKGKLFAYLSRTILFSPLAFWGVFGTPIPYQKPVCVVVGKPIDVKKNLQPSDEEVQEVHAKFISSLEELFDKHKGYAGCTDSHLSIY
eukprot:c24359_g1_i1 orf=441-1265(-)